MIRLLFIDDDPQAQKTLSMVLEEEYQVCSCFTGLEGVERVRKEDPDVVLLDINLPDIDGMEVLEKIRSMPGSPPVIIMTESLSDIVPRLSITMTIRGSRWRICRGRI